MDSHARSYHGYRFSPLIISHAVWLYHRFCLSFRDAENLLAQRGITVSYETIRQWDLTFGPEYARTLRRRRSLSVRAWGFNGASLESPVLRAVHLLVMLPRLRLARYAFVVGAAMACCVWLQSVHSLLDCAQGEIPGRVMTNARNEFNVAGTFVREHGGPIRVGDLPDSHPAAYVGLVIATTMTLTLRLTDTHEEE
jgi:hypothetical protein